MRILLCLLIALSINACATPAPRESFIASNVTVILGKAFLTADAPASVEKAIQAANRIVGKSYKYGGGHGQWEDDGYDCSGSTSYVLHAAGLLKEAMPSSNFSTWGQAGEGKWITIYARPGHVFLVIGGARFDTTDHANVGPGWRSEERVSGFTTRHPEGL